jgi:hypothetical protein
MKAYIASFFADKDRVAARAEELKGLGIECTMRWPYETAPHNSNIKDFPDEYFRETAVFDLEDILAADVLVMTVPNDTQLVDQPIRSMARGGRHFEFGFMYGLMMAALKQRELVLLGPRENVFHFLDGKSVTARFPAIKQFDNWEQVLEYLNRRNLEEQ